MKQALVCLLMSLSLVSCAGASGGRPSSVPFKSLFSKWINTTDGGTFDFTWGYFTTPTHYLTTSSPTCTYKLDISGTEQVAQMLFSNGTPGASCPDRTTDFTNDGTTLTLCSSGACTQFR